MDILTRFMHGWSEFLVDADPALKAYVVKIGLGLILASALGFLFQRHLDMDMNFPVLGQLCAIALGILITLFLPTEWVASTGSGLQTFLVTVCLIACIALPCILPLLLVRTYGRQILVRKVLYGMIIVGLLLQLAVSEGD